MDMEFEKIKDLIPIIYVNISATNVHVPEVEQGIRTIRERCQGIKGTLPFTYMPQQLMIGLEQFVIMWLNAFPSNTQISRKSIPWELISRHKLDAAKHFKTPFESYCKVDDEPDPSYSMVLHTQPAIAMGPTGNLQESYKFFCLKTGMRIIRQVWTEVPMPQSVIDAVNWMEKKEWEVLRQSFMDEKKRIIEDGINEDNFNLDMNKNIATYPNTTDFKDEIPGIEMEDHHNIKNKLFMTDSDEDINDLAKESADNADEDGIKWRYSNEQIRHCWRRSSNLR